jgi:hypothetical protein
MLNPISPSGVTLSPANFPNVSIGPNGISAPQSLIISGVGEGVNVCFETAIYKHVGQNYSWCCHGDTVCITTPLCSPPVEPCKFKAKVVEVKCEDDHGNPIYYIEFKLSNPSGNPVMINSITSSNLTLTSPGLPIILNPGTSNINCTFTSNGAPVNPTCFTFSFTDEKYPKDTCKETVCTDLPICVQPKDCGCDKKWAGDIMVGSTKIGCNSKIIKTVNAGQTTVTAPVYNCIAPCVPKYQYTVKKSGQTITSGTGNSSSFSYNFPAGTYDIIYEVFCGEKLCGECKVKVIFSGGIENPK